MGRYVPIDDPNAAPPRNPKRQRDGAKNILGIRGADLDPRH